MSLISTSLASTFFLYFSLYAIIGFFYFFKVSTSLNFGVNFKFWIILFMFILWFLNYYLFIKPRNFLRKNFQKDKKGGLFIVFVVLFIGILFLIGANKNRAKIAKDNKKAHMNWIHNDSLQLRNPIARICNPCPHS